MCNCSSLDGHAYQVNELWQTQAKLNQNRLRIIADRPNQSIVIAQQIIIKSLCIRISMHHNQMQNKYCD